MARDARDANARGRESARIVARIVARKRRANRASRADATREGDAKKNRAIRIARASFDATIVGGACVVALAGRARAVLAGDTPPGGVGRRGRVL